MRKNVLKMMMATLLMALSASFVNAQVHVGDILCEGDRVVSPALAGSEAMAVVFYVDASGQHGWAVDLRDNGELAWGPNCYNSPLRDRTKTATAVADIDG